MFGFLPSKGGEGKKDNLLLAHSPNGCNGQDYCWPKPESKCLGHLWLPPIDISRKLDWKRSSWDCTQSFDKGCQCHEWWLSPLGHNVDSYSFLFERQS